MNTRYKGLGALMAMTLLLNACGSETEPEQTAVSDTAMETETETADVATQEAADTCAPEGDLSYICGVRNAEDILHLGNTGQLLASGMSSGDIVGHLYMIDPEEESVAELLYGGGFSAELDAQAYPNCPGLINLVSYSIHGLSLREYEEDRFDLYVTSHGAREAIEVFDLDMSGDSYALQWKGCVVLPENTFANSVAILEDGGFVTTKMMDPTVGFGAINAGEITGLVYEWHPGEEVQGVEGTELSGANGIALSDDERYMYVAAFGTREIVKFDRSMNPVGKETVSVDIVPDNVRWGENGMLLTAGNNVAGDGWSVVEVDPDAMTAQRIGGADQNAAIQGVSSALQVGETIWVGSFNDDRIAHFPR